MQTLSPLELAAGVAIARQISLDGGDALIAQLQVARVTAREFTPTGFYTDFAVDPALPPAVCVDGSGGWVRSKVGPTSYPLEFILYVRDGYAVTLEAYSFHEGYGDLDLLTAVFTDPEPDVTIDVN